jgi:hypothetical protein
MASLMVMLTPPYGFNACQGLHDFIVLQNQPSRTRKCETRRDHCRSPASPQLQYIELIEEYRE